MKRSCLVKATNEFSKCSYTRIEMSDTNSSKGYMKKIISVRK